MIERDNNSAVFKVPEWEEDNFLSDHWLRLEEISGKILGREKTVRLVNKKTEVDNDI